MNLEQLKNNLSNLPDAELKELNKKLLHETLKPQNQISEKLQKMINYLKNIQNEIEKLKHLSDNPRARDIIEEYEKKEETLIIKIIEEIHKNKEYTNLSENEIHKITHYLKQFLYLDKSDTGFDYNTINEIIGIIKPHTQK